jgi:hypothetical protein
MKRTVTSSIIAFVFGLFAPQITQAQGTLYLSSLSGTSTGSAAVGSDSWLAAGFGTGNSLGGYILNSVQLGLADSSGNPDGFTVMIYSAVAGIGVAPGIDLGTLTGSANPTASGNYSFTPGSGLSLAPSTAYYIVVTASTPVATGAYNWSESAYPPSINVWSAANSVLSSNNGSSGWSVTPYLGIAQFAIYATPAPEPGVIGLFGVGGLLIGFQRWKARSV